MKFLTHDELKYFLIGLAGVTLLAVLITVLVMIPGSRQASPSVAAEVESTVLAIDDFLVPEAYKSIINTEYTWYRDKRIVWDEAEMEKYWVDPRSVILSVIRENNDDLITRLLNPGSTQ